MEPCPSGPARISLRQLRAGVSGALGLDGRKIVKNVGWLLLDRLARLLGGLAVGALVTRYLGPARNGGLAYSLAFLALLLPVANLSSDTIIVRDLVARPERRGVLLGSAFTIRILLGVACWSLGTAYLLLTERSSPQGVLLFTIVGASLLIQSADVIDLWFQSQLQSRLTVGSKLIGYAVGCAAKVLLVVWGAPLWAFAAAIILDYALAALCLAFAYHRHSCHQAWKVTAADAVSMIKEAAPFAISGVSVMLYMRIDQMLIHHYLGERALGIYAAAVPLSELLAMIPVTLAASLAPMIARLKIESEETYLSALSWIFRAFGAIALATSLLTSALSPLLVGALYGPQYAETARILAVHVFANVFIALGVAQGLWIANERAGRIIVFQTGLGALTALILGVWLIREFGTIGAAFAAVGAQAISSVLSNICLAPRIFAMQLGFSPRSSTT